MFAALALAVGIAATPQQAALNAVTGAPFATVGRTNVVGNYALVRVHGLGDERYPVSVLVEHFAFGWQALKSMGDTCYFAARGLSAKVEAALMIGQPLVTFQMPCPMQDRVDVGAPADVAVVRKMIRRPFVPSVVVSGRYALGTWNRRSDNLIPNVSQTLFERARASWHRVADSRGHLGMRELHSFGVLTSSMCALRVYDAKCVRKVR